MAAETKSQIERARNMQNYQKENVRKLHSDFGLMRTLKVTPLFTSTLKIPINSFLGTGFTTGHQKTSTRPTKTH